MAEKNTDLHDSSAELANQSPQQLRTDVSNSTAQNTVARPNASQEDPGINGGPSVGIEDSKFLMESSLNQHSVSVPQDSKFSAGPHDISQSAIKDNLEAGEISAAQHMQPHMGVI